MRREFAQELVCPQCRGPLALRAAQEQDGEIELGELLCASCARSYGIERGIPRLLPERVQAQDENWEHFHQGVDYAGIVAKLKQRFMLPEPVLLDYYAHAQLVRQAGITPGRILELGAGSGSYSLALHCFTRVTRICLVDISLSALEGARVIYKAFGLQADWVLGDIRALPFRADAFELSLSGGLIEHFAGEEQRRIVAEHCRVAPRVLIQAPVSTWAYWTFRRLYSLRPGGWPFGFEVPLTVPVLRGLLAENHFQIQRLGGHDFAASVELVARERWGRFPRLHAWPGLARWSRHDLIALAERRGDTHASQ